MDNPEKLATYGTQDEEKQNKSTTQPREAGNIWYTRRRKTKQICVGHHYTPEGIISTLDDLSCVYLQASGLDSLFVFFPFNVWWLYMVLTVIEHN